MDNCLIYARVSSKEQESEGFSIPATIKLLNEYAIQNGFNVVQEFTDIETAKKSGRTSFTKMLTYLEENPGVRTVLVEKTDRLYRNFKDYVILEDYELNIHLVKEGQVINKVQHILSEHAQTQAKTKRQFTYMGLLHCADCGCAITAEMKKANMCTITAPMAKGPVLRAMSVKK